MTERTPILGSPADGWLLLYPDSSAPGHGSVAHSNQPGRRHFVLPLLVAKPAVTALDRSKIIRSEVRRGTAPTLPTNSPSPS